MRRLAEWASPSRPPIRMFYTSFATTAAWGAKSIVPITRAKAGGRPMRAMSRLGSVMIFASSGFCRTMKTRFSSAVLTFSIHPTQARPTPVSPNAQFPCCRIEPAASLPIATITTCSSIPTIPIGSCWAPMAGSIYRMIGPRRGSTSIRSPSPSSTPSRWTHVSRTRSGAAPRITACLEGRRNR